MPRRPRGPSSRGASPRSGEWVQPSLEQQPIGASRFTTRTTGDLCCSFLVVCVSQHAGGGGAVLPLWGAGTMDQRAGGTRRGAVCGRPRAGPVHGDAAHHRFDRVLGVSLLHAEGAAASGPATQGTGGSGRRRTRSSGGPGVDAAAMARGRRQRHAGGSGSVVPLLSSALYAGK